MPDLAPFRGIFYEPRVAGPNLGPLTAPPYDVIDDEVRARLEAGSPLNVVRLTLPRPDGETDAYEAAAALLASWLSDGILVADASPAFYVYRMAFTDEVGRSRETTGVIGALELCPPDSGDVLPHEETMERLKSDRLDLLRAVRANLEPIWALSLTEGLSARLACEEPPLADCVDDEGVRHSLYRVSDAGRCAEIAGAVARAPVVIADGHHRYETALAYREEQRRVGTSRGTEHRIMALVVELSADQVGVQAIHRVVTGPTDPGDVHAALGETVELTEVGANEPEALDALAGAMDHTSSMGLVLPDRLALVRLPPEAAEDALAGVPPVLRDVDATRFEAALRPSLERRGARIVARHDHRAVAEAVRTGEGVAAVLLRPVPIATIEAAARQGVRMPPKTTFFFPKPRTGLVLRSLDLE